MSSSLDEIRPNIFLALSGSNCLRAIIDRPQSLAVEELKNWTFQTNGLQLNEMSCLVNKIKILTKKSAVKNFKTISALPLLIAIKYHRERSGSVVECLTQDRGAAGLSLISVTALWPLSKTHLS